MNFIWRYRQQILAAASKYRALYIDSSRLAALSEATLADATPLAFAVEIPLFSSLLHTAIADVDGAALDAEITAIGTHIVANASDSASSAATARWSALQGIITSKIAAAEAAAISEIGLSAAGTMTMRVAVERVGVEGIEIEATGLQTSFEVGVAYVAMLALGSILFVAEADARAAADVLDVLAVMIQDGATELGQMCAIEHIDARACNVTTAGRLVSGFDANAYESHHPAIAEYEDELLTEMAAHPIRRLQIKYTMEVNS